MLGKSLVLPVIAALAMGVSAPIVSSQEGLTGYSLFKVRDDLRLYAPQIVIEKRVLTFDDLQLPAISEQECGISEGLEKKTDQGGGRVKIRISRYVVENEHGVDRPADRKDDRLSMLRSLPSAQDKLETFGKIFEPKVNLSIEF